MLSLSIPQMLRLGSLQFLGASVLLTLASVPTAIASSEPLSALVQIAEPSSGSNDANQLPSTYRLGAGDRIHIDIFNLPEHSGEQDVLADGSVTLSWVGSVPVEGMTLDEAATAIATAYSPYLRGPIVTLSLLTQRPIQISIAGAVNRPGSYTARLPQATDDPEEGRSITVTQALQLAGGITQVANVRQVQVARRLPSGEVHRMNVDLWALLQTGDLQQDIALRDGDSIWVPTTTQIDPTEAQQLATASFSPTTMKINVVGEVARPGVVEVPPNTPLNQALLAAGGFNNSRARSHAVELVRINPDGSVSQRQIRVDFSQGVNEASNPILYPNDVVIVDRSGSARFSDSVDGILGTIGRILPIFSIFGGF